MIFSNSFTNDVQYAHREKSVEDLIKIASRDPSALLLEEQNVRGAERGSTKRLVPSPEERNNWVTLTRVIEGARLPEFFQGFDEACLQPNSLDVVVERFLDSSGKELSFPFEIKPDDYVFCESNTTIGLQGKVFACLETKSSVARIGLAAVGFSRDGGYEIFLKEYSGKISAFVKNFGSKSIIINEPSALFQVSVSERHSTFPWNVPDIYLSGEGNKLVNKANYVRIGSLFGYKLHIASDVWCMIKGEGSIDFARRKKADNHFVKAKLGSVNLEDYDFCLTVSREHVEQSRHFPARPAYVFPFHFRNIFDKLSDKMSQLESIKEIFRQVFLENNGDYLPITCNAGLCNAGWHGNLVFENILRNIKDVGSYFNPDEPFALLIPLPFAGFIRDKGRYSGAYNGQRAIQL